MKTRAAGLIVLLVVVIVFPLVLTNATVTNIAVQTVIFVAVASAWNLFSGYSGYLSLGQAIFFGTGAYSVGIAARDWHLTGDAVFALLPLAGLVAALLAIPLGLIALRVRRHTFVVITIAFFFIAQLTATNLAITGGFERTARPGTRLGLGHLQQSVLLRRADHRGRHRGALGPDQAIQVRPAAPGDQG